MQSTSRIAFFATMVLLGAMSSLAGITKTSSGGGGPVDPGQTLTYTVTVTNTDLVTWTGIRVNDPVPTGTTFVAGSTTVMAPEQFSQNYRDEFTTGNYSGSFGSLNWSTPWTEINDTANDIDVVTDPFGSPGATPPQLRVKGSSRGVQRNVDLTAFAPGTAAQLTFGSRREGLDNANDYVVFEISTNGGVSWTELARVAGPALNDGVYIQSPAINLSAYTGLATVLRIISSAALGAADIVYFDNVDIAVIQRPQATYPGCNAATLVGVAGCTGTERPSGLAYNLLPGETMTITFMVRIDIPLSPAVIEIVNNVNQTNNQLPNMETAQTRDTVRQAPIVQVASCPVVDRCGAAGDGDIDPNDLLFYTITFQNLGNQPALDFRATIAATGAMIVRGGTVGGTTAVNIAAGASYVHNLAVAVTAGCGGAVDIDIRNLTSNSGTYVFADSLTICDGQVQPGPPTCAMCFRPDVQLASCPFVDQCGGVSDGEVDPDDRLTYTLTFVNLGNAAANDFRADINATGAVIDSGGTVGGTPVINLAMGATYDHTLVADVTVLCGRTVDINVVNLRSDAPTIPYFDELTVCDVDVAPPGPNCVGCPPVPVVAVTACPLIDLCGSSGDGEADPGDQVTLTIRFTNWGRTAAVGFSATVMVNGGATIVSGGTVGPINIPRYNFYDHSVQLSVTGSCGGLVDIDIINLQSDAGVFSFPAEPALCNLPIGTTSCNSCSCVPVNPTGSIANTLRATKAGSAMDVRLDWATATVTPPNFVVFSTGDKRELVETAGGIGNETQLTMPPISATTYTNTGGVGSMPNPRFYKVLAANNCDNPVFP